MKVIHFSYQDILYEVGFRQYWIFGCIFLISIAAAAPSEAADGVDFNQEIRPILSRHCISCHGPDEADRQAGLRLDTFEGATEYAIVPGDADGSDVVDRIVTDDDSLRMPPAEHADALKPAEIELLRTWINEGAQYADHWAFVPPVKKDPLTIESKVKSVAGDPVVFNNSIDRFIVARVAKAGLKQNSPSPPRTLVRRASLSLTGLPPQAHRANVQTAIDAYLNRPDQDNFGALVDQLLETPAYAEHWANVWLDIARYADTCGYSGDETRDIWPWRDWLIRSLQAGKSYRQLSIEMLAGDLLENPTADQRLATAFHRNTLANNEGGTDDEEFRVIAVKDRLSTTLNAWMGLTVRCAECHSHKYDPISQKEYYQLYDFFNHTVDADNRDDRPKMEIVPQRDPESVAALDKKIRGLEKQLAGQERVWHVIRPREMDSRNGTQLKLLDDGAILASGPLPGVEEYAFTFELPANLTVTSIRLEAIPRVEHNGNVGRAPEGAFILSQIRFAKLTGDEEKGEGDSNETILAFSDAANDYNQANHHARTAIATKVKPGGRQGWAVKHPISGYKAHHEAVFDLAEPLKTTTATKVKLYLLFDPPWKRLNMGCVRVSVCDVPGAADKYEQKQLDPIRRALQTVLAERNAPIRVPVIQERPDEQRRQSFMMQRGNFRSPGERVNADFPQAFALASASSYPRNRLGLAQWIFADDNPLTARVAVNRYWSRMMGIGLVETEEDFGTQGTPPSHPDLLDHLSVEFRENGWKVRAFLKKVVMSATWQQSPVVTKKAFEVDPKNRLLSRGPRLRLSAEVVRDQALAVSGLLSDKLYGEPVYPPNPIKRVVNAFTGGHTWQESQGEDRYRRAIYTFLKRSAPHPLFDTFDVASRDVCSMRRQTTNTPLQSFMTLNDITFIEAARALAARMLDHPTDNSTDALSRISQQIEFGLTEAIYVPAQSHQIDSLTKAYLAFAKSYEGDLTAAAELIGRDIRQIDFDNMLPSQRDEIVQLASMTVVANVIMNLDNFLNN